MPLPDRNNIILEIGSVTAIRIFLTSVRVKLANFKSPKVKALLSKGFTFGLLKFASLTRTDVKNILMAVTLPISKIILF
ncbi:MAG: hypothetical protein ACK56Z_01105, partial [Pseudanabaena sp.]